ncbi:adenine phosphoribosyltransferase 1-like isoform X2 [Actinidia eriantha]|uniref:adenine phosphoribosyltransferase 1-like isoform X2 n=1 Tax=Actinidia eriantha TaxID=165200 RepID=UPI00258575E3|nr:adenine phosphoribosyltransferase 1-like isoform X2 [Actinidia eriantha]
MNALAEVSAIKASRVNTVRAKDRRYLTKGNSVTTLNLPNSPSSASKLVRRQRTHSHIPAAADHSVDMAASDPFPSDDRISRIGSTIRVIPDFPKPGIMFQDITTLLLDPKAFKDTIDLFVERYKDKEISVVAGAVISEEYSLEYGTDTMEMHVGAVQAGERALVIDDLIATGGTLCAAIKLLERVGVDVVECACVIELPELKGRDRLGDKPLFVLVSSA